MTQEILGLIKDFHARGTTVLVATHDPELIGKTGKRMIHIQDGRITE